jgi:hypothetical protein
MSRAIPLGLRSRYRVNFTFTLRRYKNLFMLIYQLKIVSDWCASLKATCYANVTIPLTRLAQIPDTMSPGQLYLQVLGVKLALYHPS